MEKKLRFALPSCFAGIFVQALSVNIIPVLFIPLKNLYSLTYAQLGIMVGLMFAVQVVADIIASMLVDKVGYKALAVPSSLFAVFGMILFAIVPYIMNNVYVGFLIAISLISVSSGMIEVVVSPIADAVPSKNKGALMSFVHSSYAWGQVLTIIVTTLLLLICGNKSWQFIVLGWSIVPFGTFVMYSFARYPDAMSSEKLTKRGSLLKSPYFILCMFAIMFGGATEVLMNQWSSAFLEQALALPKVTGDLLGMCGFAVMLGLGRVLYGIRGKNLQKFLTYGSIFSVVCYLVVALSPFNFINVIACAICGFTVSMLWPGTLVVASKRFPFGGGFLFGVLAIMGDLGASIGPSFAGAMMDGAVNTHFASFISNLYNITLEQSAMRLSILICALLPVGAAVCHLCLTKLSKQKEININIE